MIAEEGKWEEDGRKERERGRVGDKEASRGRRRDAVPQIETGDYSSVNWTRSSL
ncbi:MAG: hypothetical protein R6W81_08060 [Bacteroidales bacterium]